MNNKRRGKNLLYDDYDDDFEDYDNYNEKEYCEFDCKEKKKIANIKEEKGSNKKKENIKSVKNDIIKKKENINSIKNDTIKKKENINSVTNDTLKKKENIITLENIKDNNKYIMLNTLNILVLGHIDAGKSTLIGALLYNLNYVSEQTIKKYEHVRESAKYTYILDEEEDERERNITLFNKRKEFYIYYTKDDIKLAYDIITNENVYNNHEQHKQNIENYTNNIYTNKNIYVNKNIFEDFYKKKVIHDDVICIKKINIFDTPGHNELVNNLHTCCFYADCAILVVDGNNIYNKKNDETYRNVCILKSVGINNVIIVINKLDLFDYDIKVFEHICCIIKSYFECPKNDSIYEFVFNLNFYVHKKCLQNENKQTLLLERNLIFTPVSAYKNKNIVNFEQNEHIPLFNKYLCLYNQIKFMNIKKDLFFFKVCEQILDEQKKDSFKLNSYYNFVKNKNHLFFANNIFFNFDKEKNQLNSIKNVKNEDNHFVGVVQDFTQSNNMIKASIKILHGYLKTKGIAYTLLPWKENVTIKKIETKNDIFYKFINIDYFSILLANTPNIINIIKNIPLPQSKNLTILDNKNVDKEPNKSNTYKEQNYNIPCSNVIKHKINLDQNNFFLLNTIENISELAKYCSLQNEHLNITNDIIDNVYLKIDDNKINNGCVLINRETLENEEEQENKVNKENKQNKVNKENKEKCNLFNTIHNNSFHIIPCNKFKVLIKLNEIRIPLIIGRQYLFYSLNYAHSVTVTNIFSLYKKNISSNSDHLSISSNKLKFADNKNITDIENYQKSFNKNSDNNNFTFYEKIDNKKCLRSHDTGIIEIQVNNNSLICAQYFREELKYFISLDTPFFNIYDFLFFTISPLSRFILSEENQIIASGLILTKS
ncbi:elongation factor Tu, putative [Plasmodium sp. DRC-Itaito]|nr:elongation factor Tu, putative [Plasmodium sp. DRC-Itaito]